MIPHLRIARILLFASGLSAAIPVLAQKAFLDVGKQPDITILIAGSCCRWPFRG